jgi:hypothetical protein
MLKKIGFHLGILLLSLQTSLVYADSPCGGPADNPCPSCTQRRSYLPPYWCYEDPTCICPKDQTKDKDSSMSQMNFTKTEKNNSIDIKSMANDK